MATSDNRELLRDAALTGDQATFGSSTDNGVQLAAKELNAAGGINGKKLVVVSKDDGGKPVDEMPFPVDASVLRRGQQRYMIFCSPCHSATGDGRGMIVQRGFSPPPPLYGKRPATGKSPAATFYEDLRDAPVGHFFGVITHGHGAMYSYAARIPPKDRWMIAAYIRALQLSQYARADELPPADLNIHAGRAVLATVTDVALPSVMTGAKVAGVPKLPSLLIGVIWISRL